MATAKKEAAPKEFPSEFGSHTSMIDAAETEKLGDPTKVVLKDQFGYYTTERHRLDVGTADPNRWVWSREAEWKEARAEAAKLENEKEKQTKTKKKKLTQASEPVSA